MRRILLAWCIVAGGTAAPASAQEGSLRGRLEHLFTFGSCGRPLCLDGSVSAANGHGDHFLPDLAASNAAIISFLSGAIAANVGSVPSTASAGGITYKFVGGLPVKTSESVGPIFAERAQTLGRGVVFLGMRASKSALRTLRGVPIDRLVLNFTHQDVAPAGLGDPVLENDVLEVNLALGVGIDVTSFFLTYGVSDRVDVGLVVPLVHASLQARADAQIHPFGSTAVHFFTGTAQNPGLQSTSATFGSATEVGDVALRGKVSLASGERFGLGLMGDVRLPTGNEDNFTGAGAASARALLLASARFGDFSPHLNLGYALRGGANRNNVVLLTAGFDQPVNNWATLATEVVSEWQPGGNETVLPGTVSFAFPFVRTMEPTNIPNSRDHRVLGSFGAKFRTSDNGPILLANMLVPIRRGGLQPTGMWTVGLDLGF